MDELVGGLRAVAHRQRGVHVELARLAGPGNQVVDRDLAQRVARALRLPRVTLHEAPVGAADLRNRLTVEKWTTSSTSMLSSDSPQRTTGSFNMSSQFVIC